ncbi:MAG: alpha/beta hydrolase [Balneolaceae bacterium]
MFRINPDNPFQGPHQNQKIITGGADPEQAKGAMILIHGRGATAESILTLAGEFDEPGLHYTAPQAQGFQWYPYSFLAPADQNEPGISSGLQAIYDVFSGLESAGITKEKIIILGFSQGACLASEYVARHPGKYGGLAVLSGGLIGETLQPEKYSGSLDETPVFMGCSDIDPHIPLERVHESARILEDLGADLTKNIYPGMGHTVIGDEIEEVKKMIQAIA